jgi:CRP-like cAMP-binding protein
MSGTAKIDPTQLLFRPSEGPVKSPLLLKFERRDRLSGEEQHVLEAIRSANQTLRAGDELVREGDRPSFSCLMLQGWSARVKVLSGGQRAISALHLAGDFVDLHSLLLRPMDHSVVALTACKIAIVPHDRLKAVTERHPHLTRLLWLDTLVDAAVHREWIAGLARRSAASRLAHLFCELLLRCDAVGRVNDLSYDLPLTQAILADTLGLSTVHVNRSLQELRQDRLVSLERNRLKILNWDRLAELADFDPAYLNLSGEPR